MRASRHPFYDPYDKMSDAELNAYIARLRQGRGSAVRDHADRHRGLAQRHGLHEAGLDDMTSETRPDPVLGTRFVEALCLAVDLHSQQARKGSSVPYMGHLLGVCGLVIDSGGSEDEAIAAVLHDAVEDQGGAATLERIRTQFGSNVAATVEACSDTDMVPKPPWRARKEAYVEHLRTAPTSALRVSLADKLNNLRAIVQDFGQIGGALWARFDPESDPIWYYGTLLRVFEDRLRGPMTEDRLLVPMTAELRHTYSRLLELMNVAT